MKDFDKDFEDFRKKINDEFEKVDYTKKDINKEDVSKEYVEDIKSVETSAYDVEETDSPSFEKISPIFEEDVKYISKDDNAVEDTEYYLIENNDTSKNNKENRNDSFYKETVRHESTKNKKGKFKRIVAVVAVASILGGPALGFGMGAGSTFAKNYIGYNNNSSKENEFAFENKDNASSKESSIINSSGDITSVAGAVALVKPSIVSIVTSSEVASDGFFMMPGTKGAGSGIIFSQDDEKVYIVTNHHVVSSTSPNAKLNVGVVVGESDEMVKASLVGKQQKSDLAVISVKKSDLKAIGINEITEATFGNSDDMQVGEPTVALGNALGEGIIATYGILSAEDKMVSVEGLTLNVIQTDAAINFGNSGGALINNKGEVIGINTAKLVQNNVEGMGYSISSNVAMPIIKDIMNKEGGAVLGILGSAINEETMEKFNLSQMGVLVHETVGGSGAEKAGLQPYDIITSLNNQPILTFERLQELLSKEKAGNKVTVKILRNGTEEMDIDVILSESIETDF